MMNKIRNKTKMSDSCYFYSIQYIGSPNQIRRVTQAIKEDIICRRPQDSKNSVTLQDRKSIYKNQLHICILARLKYHMGCSQWYITVRSYLAVPAPHTKYIYNTALKKKYMQNIRPLKKTWLSLEQSSKQTRRSRQYTLTGLVLTFFFNRDKSNKKEGGDTSN